MQIILYMTWWREKGNNVKRKGEGDFWGRRGNKKYEKQRYVINVSTLKNFHRCHYIHTNDYFYEILLKDEISQKCYRSPCAINPY